jgi:hypothetical protein
MSIELAVIQHMGDCYAIKHVTFHEYSVSFSQPDHWFPDLETARKILGEMYPNMKLVLNAGKYGEIWA